MKKNIAILILIIALIVAVIVLAVKLANVKKEDYSGFKMYKNIISQDEVENTLFGQPISAERNGEYRIGIKTAIDGDFHATLTIYKA